MKKIKLFILVGIVLGLLIGCSGGNTSSTQTAATTNLVISTDADLSSMDHSLATDGTAFSAIMMAISGLVELDANGVPKPDVAEKWEKSDDGLIYTFYLKDTKWSDGTPVTANDFVFAWRRLADPKTASEYNYLLDTIHVVNADKVINKELPVEELGIKAIDEKTFEITLSLPCDFLLSLMAFPSFFPLNEAHYNSQGDEYATAPDKMIYNGPFLLESWIPGNGFTFIKNPGYHDADQYKQEKIEFKYIQDTQSAMLEYQTGNLDVVKLSGEMVDAYKNEPGFTERLQGYLWFLSINHEIDTLKNENLRKAFALAIDRQTIVNNVLKDGSIEADGIIPFNFAPGPNGKAYREETDDLTEYNPSKAAEYYEAAKAELNGDVTIELLFEDSEASKAVAEYIQNNLETNLKGMVVNLNSKPKKTRLKLMTDGEYEVALHRWGPDYDDPQTYIDLFLSESSMNHGKYNNPAYDELVFKAIKGEFAADSAKRWETLIQAEKLIISENAGVVPIYQNGGAMMINPSVSQIEFHTAGVDNYRHAIKE